MNDEIDKLDVALTEALRLAWPIPEPPTDPAEAAAEDERLLLLLEEETLEPRPREQLRQQVQGTAWGRQRLAILREALADAETDTETDTAAATETACAATLAEAAPRAVRLAFAWAADGLRYLWGSLEPGSLVATPVPTRGAALDASSRPPASPPAGATPAGATPAGATPAVEETTYFDFTHRFGDVELVLQIERVPDDRLDVQLSFDRAQTRGVHLRVDLADEGGRLLDSQPVERGTARFASLPPCPHHIRVSTAQQELGRVRLDILGGLSQPPSPRE